MITNTIRETLMDTVLTWEGVTISPHQFGGIEFRVDHREIGHLHGNYQADIPFSARLHEELVASERASLHHISPNSGWVSFYVRSADDVSALIGLLQLNYDRLTAHYAHAAA